MEEAQRMAAFAAGGGMSGNKHCCLCGEVRLPLSSAHRVVKQPDSHAQHERASQAEALAVWETSPQLLVNVALWRNGGTAKGAAHICDGCLIVGLEEARKFVEHELPTRRALVRARAEESRFLGTLHGDHS